MPLPEIPLEPADDVELVWPEVDSRGWFLIAGTGPDKQPYHTNDPENGDPFILLANGKFVTADASHEDLLSALLAQGVSLDEISGFGWWRISGRVKGLDAFSQGFEEWNGDPMNPAQILDALENSGADLSVCEFDAQFGSEHQGLMWRGAAAEMFVGQILSHEGDAYKLLSGYSSADDGAGNRVVFWNDLVAWEATAEGQSFTIRVNAARREPAEGTITVRADGNFVAAHYTAVRFGQDQARAAAAWSVVHDKFTFWLTDSGASWAMGSETAPTEDISVAATRPATVVESAQRSERIIRAEPEGQYSPNAASEAASWLAEQLDGWPTEQVNLACAELTAIVTDAAEHRRGRVHLVAEITDDNSRCCRVASCTPPNHLLLRLLKRSPAQHRGGIRHSPSAHRIPRRAGPLLPCDHDVVEEAEAYSVGGFGEDGGGAAVVGAGGGIAGGVVVDYGEGAAVVTEDGVQDFPDRDGDLVDGAFGDEHLVAQPVLRVAYQYQQSLHTGAGELRAGRCGYVGGAGQPGRGVRPTARSGAEVERGDDRGRLRHADPGPPRQFLRTRGRQSG